MPSLTDWAFCCVMDHLLRDGLTGMTGIALWLTDMQNVHHMRVWEEKIAGPFFPASLQNWPAKQDPNAPELMSGYT